MTYKSVTEILQAIKKKKISASEITSEYLKRIKASDGLNCFITLTEDFALNRAKEIDKDISKNNLKPLSGLPIAQKDIFCTKGVKTS